MKFLWPFILLTGVYQILYQYQSRYLVWYYVVCGTVYSTHVVRGTHQERDWYFVAFFFI